MSFVPTDDGRWVSEHYERLARVVQDYDPRFELRWIPPEYRTAPEDKSRPYVIWDTLTNLPVFYASELDTPEQILQRLFDGDTAKGDVLARLDNHNRAAKALEMKAKLDAEEERQDYIAHLIGNKNNYIRLKGGTKVDDQLRPIL